MSSPSLSSVHTHLQILHIVIYSLIESVSAGLMIESVPADLMIESVSAGLLQDF